MRTWPIGVTRFSLCVEIAGLLYEQIVFIPNFFALDALVAKEHFRAFHGFTNPEHFHSIPGMTIAFGLLAAGRAARGLVSYERVMVATKAALLAGLLTGVAVGWLNNRMFFSEPMESSEALRRVAVVWSAINIGRIALLSFAFWVLERVTEQGESCEIGKKDPPAWA